MDVDADSVVKFYDVCRHLGTGEKFFITTAPWRNDESDSWEVCVMAKTKCAICGGGHSADKCPMGK